MVQPGIEGSSFNLGLDLFTPGQEVVAIAIDLTFGRAIPLPHDLKLQIILRLPVIVIPDRHSLRHHLMLAVQIPHRIPRVVIHPRRVTQRQCDVVLVIPLVITKPYLINPQPAVRLEAIPDPHFRQEPLNKVQIALLPLHHQFPPGVFPHQREQKILATKTVSVTQDLFHNFRDRLMLVNGATSGMAQQRQTRFQTDLIVGFIRRGGNSVKPGDHAIHFTHLLRAFWRLQDKRG
ncbi:hypothetical protein Ppb6_03317 [Photorhabdus australis subsp. thailandensis]|uniref:Uncharacterized protein n=1 Tax=Photorhabdus australis subsp. thailandensis TaxID=2805096 RepID=A0A1C0U0P9_9GAMM|nr:hypothetical protein Ppb6_03317 [Photorhabdus australis subsp. thailandensis]